MGLYVLLIRADERPNFIGLNALEWQVAQGPIHEPPARRTEFDQQRCDRLF